MEGDFVCIRIGENRWGLCRQRIHWPKLCCARWCRERLGAPHPLLLDRRPPMPSAHRVTHFCAAEPRREERICWPDADFW